jgi:hypothetical protein
MSTHALHGGEVKGLGRLGRLRARVGHAHGAVSSADVPSPTLDELLVPSRWQRKVGSPELKKALGYLQGAIADVRRLLAVPPDSLSLRTPEIERRFRDVLDQPVESLTIDSTWELYGQVKAMLPLLANGEYLAAQLDYEAQRAKDKSRWHGWNQHFGKDELTQMRSNYRRREPSQTLHRQAAEKLAFLYTQRTESGRDRRARAAQKCRYLNALAPVLLLLQAGLVIAIDYFAADEVWKAVAVAGTAGALGAALSGTMRIRDDLSGLDDLRSFWPAIRVQPLVGATAGLVVLLLMESGTLDIGSDASGHWPGQALLAFLAGFSEPFFLGLVQRVAVIPDKSAVESA